MQAIERDLVRWRRGKWLAVVVFIFALQIGLFVWASQKDVQKRAVYPSEPRISFGSPARVLKQGSLELENPFLFAAASRQGFSGEAWLRAPSWPLPKVGRPLEPDYLELAEAREVNRQQDGNQGFALVPARRTGAQLPQPEEPTQSAIRSSELRLDGFHGRTLVAPLVLPVQYHTDVLSSTVVEAMIGRDGFVISARIIENSGSAKADAEALALARRARLNPVNIGENVAVVGKLIFEWFALSLSHTNSVVR
jgi:hypothetical protein